MDIQKSIKLAVSRVGTQDKFANLCRVSQPMVSKWLNGEAKPSVERAIDIDQVSGGEVFPHDLRPDKFGEPTNPEQAA